MRTPLSALFMLALAATLAMPAVSPPAHAAKAQVQATKAKKAGKARAPARQDKGQKQPVDIEADSMEVLEDRNMVIFTGNVRAVKGDTKLFAKRLEVYLDKKEDGKDEVREVVASGGVRIVKPGMTITGQRARMDIKRDLAWVTGNVVVKRADAVIRGQKLFANLRTNVTRVDAGKRRVRATFTTK